MHACMHACMNYKLYIIFYYIYVLILVEKPKEQPKGWMEEPGKDGGKEDSECHATTTTTSSSAAPTSTATSTPALGSPPPRCLSGPPSAHGEYRECVVDKVAERAASEEKERERGRLAEWTPHVSQEMQEAAASDDGPCAYGLEASVGDSGKLNCIFR